MWDKKFGHLPGYQPWDDSIIVRNLFLGEEGGKTRVPTNLSYDEWDCTALFQATIYARSFALHHGTLGDLYVKPRRLPPGNFHASVVSPGGNNAETFALAIDQLRRLRNALCHSSSAGIDKVIFEKWVQHAKDAFKALGVKTEPIDDVLTGPDFPTERVRALEEDIIKELQREIQFLQGEVKDGLLEVRPYIAQSTQELLDRMKRTEIERKEELRVLENQLRQLQEEFKVEIRSTLEKYKESTEVNQEITERGRLGAKVSLPRSCLPPKVKHFTGRQEECKEILSHMTSESDTRIVSIWGSPGFGKTSVAVAVGHHFHSQGLPVYFLSLRGLQSKADLASKLLSILRQPVISGQSSQRLSLEDELCNLLTGISGSFLLILDNADELFASGVPKVKEEVIHLLEEILRRNERVKIAVTTRESLEFLNVHFQGHHAVRIRPLDNISSQKLVHDLLPNASTSDSLKIAQICGNVPLSIKLMSNFISDDNALSVSQSLDDFINSTVNIAEILDNPDYPSNLRLQFLFESSFQRLSAQEKESLVSLCILRENFDQGTAAAVLGKTEIQAKKVLQSLQRKSLLDSSSESETFSMHTLIQSFTREKGEHEMKETFLKSKSRFYEFYVSLFEKLNNGFLSGRSNSAYIGFYEEKESIIQSLTESCYDAETASGVFDILVKAELFLDSLFWLLSEAANFEKLYDSAVKAANDLENSVFYRRLLVSRAFSEIAWGTRGKTMQLLSEAKQLQATSSTVTAGEKGKWLCYQGFYQLVTAQTQNGVQSLQEALSLMDKSAEETILRIIIFQILAVYYQFQKYSISSTYFYSMALQECRTVRDTHAHLLVIPAMPNITMRAEERKITHRSNVNTLLDDQPLQLQVIFLVKEATRHFTHVDIEKTLANITFKMLSDVETALTKGVSLGLFNFYRIVVIMFQSLMTKSKDAKIELAIKRINFHQAALEQCKKGNERNDKINVTPSSDMHKDALAKSYLDLGAAQRATRDFVSALQSEKCALDMRLEQFGKEHSSVADCLFSLGATQYATGDFASAFQSTQRALNIRLKLFGEEHPSTAYSHYFVGATQHKLGDFSSALQSKQRALDIRLKLFGEEHSSTADSYYSLAVTQQEVGDTTAALQSKQRALDVRRKLFGEECSSTANSYSRLAVKQHELGDYTSDRTEWLDINDFA
ncbi:hypothetical protein ACROYT_G026809 [Oculina patagonica]